LAKAIGGIASVLKRHPNSCPELADGLLILTESLAELGAPVPCRKQQLIEQLAILEREMRGCSPAQRRNAAMSDLGIQRSYYYEIRAAAIEERLLDE
jgi:hypothetical protein